MSSSDSPLDYVDYTAIDFPSDQISVRHLRRAHPERFDVEDGSRFKHASGWPVEGILIAERYLARNAYEIAIGKARPLLSGSLSRDDCLEDLTKFYPKYDISSGPQHTEQLVRNIESQAANQAKKQR